MDGDTAQSPILRIHRRDLSADGPLLFLPCPLEYGSTPTPDSIVNGHLLIV